MLMWVMSLGNGRRFSSKMFVSIHQIYCLDQSEDANSDIKQDNKKTNDHNLNSNDLAMTFHYN